MNDKTLGEILDNIETDNNYENFARNEEYVEDVERDFTLESELDEIYGVYQNV